ncbi:TPA: hypothetical protein BOS_3558 [Bos taurus]|nr:TPA: hypothetical protein BOS_3558 [Bos taurus]
MLKKSLTFCLRGDSPSAKRGSPRAAVPWLLAKGGRAKSFLLVHTGGALGHLFPEHIGRGRQLRVLRFQGFHFFLQPRDPLQLPFPALGGSDAVPHALPLCLDPLLGLHVDGGQGRRFPGHLGHRLRLLLQGLQPRVLHGDLLGQVVRRLRRLLLLLLGLRGKGQASRAVGGRPAAAAQRAGVEVAEVGVDRRLAVQAGAEATAAAAARHRGHRRGHQARPADRLRRRRDAGQRVLAVQFGQGAHEALGESLLLVRHVLGAQELGSCSASESWGYCSRRRRSQTGGTRR